MDKNKAEEHFSIEYKLERSHQKDGSGSLNGWAVCVVRTGSDEVEMTPGYLTDPLGDMIRAALFMLGDGSGRASFLLDGEGVEWKWHMYQGAAWLIEHQVAAYHIVIEDSYSEVIFDVWVPKNTFNQAVIDVAKSVLLDTDDGETYVWGEYSFPFKELELLEGYHIEAGSELGM